MKILAMDIGAGTIDVLLHVTGDSLENSVKMVLPSPSQVYARRVLRSTESRRDLHIGGDIIGARAKKPPSKAPISIGMNRPTQSLYIFSRYIPQSLICYFY